MPWDFALILGVLAVLIPWRGAARVRELLRRPFELHGRMVTVT